MLQNTAKSDKRPKARGTEPQKVANCMRQCQQLECVPHTRAKCVLEKKTKCMQVSLANRRLLLGANKTIIIRGHKQSA